MKVYTCGICGFEYDEGLGDPLRGIAPGTKWEDVPDDWVCPICGADKSMFAASGDPEQQQYAAADVKIPEDHSLGAMENAALLSNLARACQKQYRFGEEALLRELAGWFEAQAVPAGSFADIATAIKEDVGYYPTAMDAAKGEGDRGTLRALTWGEKVTRIQGGLLKKAEAGAEKAVQGRVFVCEACGFIFVGDAAPEICPVCKVPAFKFNEVKRGA